MKFIRNGSLAFSSIEFQIENKIIIVNRKYQRDYVWSNRLKRDLIISILKKYPIGSFIFREKEQENGNIISEIVDGQQRLLTIYDFITGKLTLNSVQSKLAQQIMNKKTKNKYPEPIIKFSQLKQNDSTLFLNGTSVPFESFQSDSEDEVADYFSKIQNQEQVKAGEIISNIPTTKYEFNYDDEITEIDKIIEDSIDWKNNNRKEILKLLFINTGVYLDLINFGIKDDDVIKFVREIDLKLSDKDKFKSIFKKSLRFLLRLNNQILKVGQAKKRFIKLFLLLTNDLQDNTNINLNLISKINYYMSEYNSRKTRENKKIFEDKLKKELILMKEENISLFEDLYYIFQGRHNLKEINQIIKKWSLKISNN